MKASQTPPPAIDWPAVLGPLLTASSEAEPSVIPVAELPTLQRATLGYARRAVRPREGLVDAQLPFACEPVPWYPQGRFVLDQEPPESTMPPPALLRSAGVRPGAFLQYAAGDYYIQDAGSMLALALCDVKPGEWVCDTCAAPGGKATGLLQALAGRGVLIANEAIRSRVALLNLALARCGYGNHMTTNLELEGLRELCGRAFDCVLVDAPCTGQTMVAQGKQSLAAFSEAQIAHSSRRQQRLLSAAAGLVKPSGRLVYSTCAYSFAENEQMVFDFLTQRPDWRLASRDALKPWQSPLATGCYRVWPHRHGCRGAFAALLVNDSDDCDGSRSEPSGKATGSRSRRTGSRWEQLQALPAPLDWMGLDEASAPSGSPQWWQAQGQLHRFDAHIPPQWIEAAVAGRGIAELQAERGRPTRSQLHRGNVSWQRWLPSFGACQLTAGAARVPCCELDDSQAIRYVAGEAVPFADADADGQWCLVDWRGRKLSWGKLTQGVLKNHFPKALRQTAVVGVAP